MKDFRKVYIFFAIVIFSIFGLVLISCGSGGGGGGGGGNFSISGMVTLDGVGLSGVTMTLAYSNFVSGESYTKTMTTDSNGNYKFDVNAGSCTITPLKYGFKFGTRSMLVTNDVSGVNFTAASCQAECPVIQQGYYPENNFVITKSSSNIYDNNAFEVWNGYYQAVLIGATVIIDGCGGATSVNLNYSIDGQSLSQMYQQEGFLSHVFLCWDGDHPQNCMPIPNLDSSGYIIMGWRYPSLGSHTWSVQATNLYSGCTTTSEVRTLIIEP